MLRGDRSREVTALAGITCALGLVYLWRKLNVLTRRVTSLADRVKQHETDIEWLSCLETFVGEGLALVNSSIGFDNIAPQDGSSVWSQAVDQAREEGTLVARREGVGRGVRVCSPMKG